MDKNIIAITIVGLDKQELAIIGILLDLVNSERYGEIPGRNVRLITDLTKEQLFSLLERLVQRNIVKYLKAVPVNTVYIKGGEGFYVFNKNYKEWVPTNDSLFYKLCKVIGLRYNNSSYNYIIENMDIRTELTESKGEKEKGITPYEVYDLFCGLYQRYFRKEYKPLNQYKDFQTIKNIICKFNYDNIKDNYIKEFINWVFMVKIKEFRGDFIIGLLPLCLKDYLASNVVEKIKPGFEKDENGRLKRCQGE